ncbi:hypothetical protein BESB_078380 [Besnoitia besnoiti]|uniref:Ribosomal RNA-processing protein 14/surfeit locus protein 6 C-terminal domain-containing protein n=1 Tax=Besnoitia besnoiti TaxID=94643 RepID=A0A2A9ME10_BESBE|nr:hypothetical protein BESB_078380 [Besnoitia besnoiti]PFH33622.1 hypothetical protein BESB_078380 [Besnoitia besnoiti]
MAAEAWSPVAGRVRVKREQAEERAPANGAASPSAQSCPGAGAAEPQQSCRRRRIRELAVHFGGELDELLAMVPFSALCSGEEEAEPVANEQPEPQNKADAAARSRGKQKKQLRQKRYHPRVLTTTPLRLQAHVAAEEERSRKRQGPRPSLAHGQPKHAGRAHASSGAVKPEKGDAVGGAANSRTELQQRLQAKIEALRRVKKEGKRERKNQRKKGQNEQAKSPKAHASEHQAQGGRGDSTEASKNKPGRRDGEADAGDYFEYGAVTCPRDRLEAPQANRSGSKKRKLRRAMKEIEANREVLQKCQSAAERQQMQLQQSMAKAMKKLDGEKVMDDMQRLKKKQKLLDKKKEKAAEQWQNRLKEAREKQRDAVEVSEEFASSINYTRERRGKN